MKLTPNHLHQTEDISGHVATIWPAPEPGTWHVATTRKQATEEPVATDQVEVVLAVWGFSPCREWTHWPGSPVETNPAPAIWAGYDRIGR